MAQPLWGSLLQWLERSPVPTLNGLFITAVWGAGVQAEVSTSKVTVQFRPHLQPDKPIVTANKTILIFFSKWQQGCGSYWSGSSTYHSPNLQCADAKAHVSGLNYTDGLYMVACLRMLLLHRCVWLPPAPISHMPRKSFYCLLIFKRGNVEALRNILPPYSRLWVWFRVDFSCFPSIHLLHLLHLQCPLAFKKSFWGWIGNS